MRLQDQVISLTPVNDMTMTRQLLVTALVCLSLSAAQGQTTLTNWALAGTATQSSTLVNPANPIAPKAIDGNHDGNTGNGSVAHTANAGSTEWWEVDLGAARPVGGLHVWLEQDCCFSLQDNLHLVIYDSTNTATRIVLWQTNVVRQVGQARDFAFDVLPLTTGRAVRVEHPSGTYANLALAELEVFNVGNTNPPVIVTNYVTTSDAARLYLLFSKGLDPTSATNAANYVYAGGVITGSLLLQPDGQTVVLTLGNVAPGQSVSLTVSSIRDVGGYTMATTNLNALIPTLAAPLNLLIAAATNQISLSWSSSFGASGYLLSRGGSFLAAVAGTNYMDTAVMPGASYCYAVVATNATGSSPASATSCATIPIPGATLTWDGNTASAGAQDGSGTWGGTATNWWSSTNNVAWFDGSVAVFGINTTTNCTVTLANDVVASGLTFNSTGGGTYTIAGTSGIVLSNLPVITANVPATISARLKGSGGFIKSGNGTLTLPSQSASLSGDVTVNGGALKAEYINTADGTLPNVSSITINTGGTVVSGNNGLFGWNTHVVPITINAGGTLTTDNGGAPNIFGLVTLAGGALASGSPHSTYGSYNLGNTLAATDNSAISAQDVQFRSSPGTITVSSGKTLSVTGYFGNFGHSTASGLAIGGGGTLLLAGANTCTGPTTVSNGTLIINGSLPASALTVAPADALAGTGTISGPVTVNGVIAPGGSVGTLSTGAETWNSGGSYVCELYSTNATGCDLLNITGALNVQAAPGSPFTVRPVSLTSSNTPGRLANFNKFANCAWTIAMASGGVTNFATNKFTVDTSCFSNDLSGGVFSLAVAGNNLVVNYTAAPLVPPRFTGFAALGSAGMQLTATGGVGEAYVLFGATNLATAYWLPLVTNTAGTNGVVQFADPWATNYTRRFYRLSVP